MSPSNTGIGLDMWQSMKMKDEPSIWNCSYEREVEEVGTKDLSPMEPTKRSLV